MNLRLGRGSNSTKHEYSVRWKIGVSTSMFDRSSPSAPILCDQDAMKNGIIVLRAESYSVFDRLILFYFAIEIIVIFILYQGYSLFDMMLASPWLIISKLSSLADVLSGLDVSSKSPFDPKFPSASEAPRRAVEF